MKNEQSSYRQLFKSTSLFGGVQLFNIIIALIRSKIVAVLLGATGMGILGLFYSSLGLLSGLTGLGIGASAVKNIAAANDDNTKLSNVAVTVRRIIWITGILGSLVTVVIAPWLSKITFGNDKFTVSFYWLAISLLITQVSSAYNSLLQGMRRLADLARANVIGSMMGLLVTIPLYYKYNVNGIVPGIILSSLFTLIVSYYFLNKAPLKLFYKPSWRETLTEGKAIISMGFLISLSSLASFGESYMVRIFISTTGSMKDVGLFNAGFAIIGTYVGMIFMAMATDYYPRLAAVAHDEVQANSLINQQTEIAILILAPVLSLFLVFADWAIIILYSSEFLPVAEMVHWAAMGMYFKAVCWALGFIFLAKGNTRIFFWSEMISVICILALNIIGYKFFKLKGLGISFLIAYIISFFQVWYFAKRYYTFSFKPSFPRIFLMQFVIGGFCFGIARFMDAPGSYIFGTIFIACSLYISYKELDKRMDLNGILARINKKK